MTRKAVAVVGLVAGAYALVPSGTATASQQTALVVERAETALSPPGALEGHAHFADSTIGTSRVTTDGYDSLAQGSARTSSLRPDARYTIKMHLAASVNPSAVVSVDAAPTAVVFDNDVAVGDDDDISLIFRDRVDTAETWRRFEQLVTELNAGPSTAEMIEAMRSRWVSIEDAAVHQGLVYGEITRYLTDGLAKARQDPCAAQLFIERISAEATRKRSTAEAHSKKAVSIAVDTDAASAARNLLDCS